MASKKKLIEQQEKKQGKTVGVERSVTANQKASKEIGRDIEKFWSKEIDQILPQKFENVSQAIDLIVDLIIARDGQKNPSPDERAFLRSMFETDQGLLDELSRVLRIG